jgi:VIT1/CCC1 family predicted Fe2+/Mn2+ transporter
MSQDTAGQTSKRILHPIERLSEVLFGLIMVLTFTGSLNAAESGRAEIRTMLFGALGCNVAWGVIDAFMYLMARLSEKAQERRTALAVKQAATPETAHSVIARALPPVAASALGAAEFEKIRVALEKLPASSSGVSLHLEDWLGAAGVFLMVFVSTLPVVLPFVILSDAPLALRVSNGIAIVMLAGTGYAFGRITGYHPVLTAATMIVTGVALVGFTIALGG